MPKAPRSKRYRSFTITAFCKDEPKNQDWFSYLCYQQEIAPTTQTLHWQAYIYINESMSLSACIQALPKEWKAHVIASTGTPKQNIAYCSKPDSAVAGTFKEYGTRPSQGKRNDLQISANQVMSGGLTAVTSDIDIIKYGRGLKLLQQVRAAGKSVEYKKPHVVWYWGPTGTGKTKAAYDADPTLYHQTSPQGWFDGYFGQKTLLIDDFTASTFDVRELLQMLDGYKYQCKVKGGFEELKATQIFITSHFHPLTYFGNRWSEIERRLTLIVEKGEGTVLPLATSVAPCPTGQFIQNK